MAIVIVNIIMQIMVDCCKSSFPYLIKDMPPLLTNRPISKEKEFEIERINKEVSDFLKKENILFVSSLNNNE